MPGCAFRGAPQFERTGGEPEIRVAILAGKKSILIDGNILMLKADGEEIDNAAGSLLIEWLPGGYRVGDETYYSDLLSVEGRHLRVEGRAFRGSLSIVRENKSLTVINMLGMESYLFGLINHEISSAWPMEAVKSQAVSARSYAYNKIRLNNNNQYHLQSSVLDQVYGGRGSEDERAREAVNRTKGEILFYDAEPANTLYHSSCGGHTESAVNLWGMDYPYLRGVKDEYCTNAPNYFWTYTISFPETRELMFPNESLQERRLKITILESAIRNIGKVFLLLPDILIGVLFYRKKGYIKFLDYYTQTTVEKII